MTTGPALRRVRQREAAGNIQGYTALVDQVKAGLSGSVFVSEMLERQSEDAMSRFEAAVVGSPEVMECYLMTGPRGYLLGAIARDLSRYERFVKETLTRLDGIAIIESSFALGQVKHLHALPLGRPWRDE